MLFVDASVAVAILAGEDDAGELMHRLEQHDGPFYVSPVVRMEASLSLTRRMAEATGRDRPATPDMLAKARRMVDQFFADLEAKEAMISVLLERLDRLLAEDLAAMAAAPEGAAAYFIRSSVWADTALDRVFVAATRLAEVAHAETLRRMAGVQASWLELLAADVGPEMARPVLYMGDGLYFNAMLARGSAAAPLAVDGDVENLLVAVGRLRRA